MADILESNVMSNIDINEQTIQGIPDKDTNRVYVSNSFMETIRRKYKEFLSTREAKVEKQVQDLEVKQTQLNESIQNLEKAKDLVGESVHDIIYNKVEEYKEAENKVKTRIELKKERQARIQKKLANLGKKGLLYIATPEIAANIAKSADRYASERFAPRMEMPEPVVVPVTPIVQEPVQEAVQGQKASDREFINFEDLKRNYRDMQQHLRFLFAKQKEAEQANDMASVLEYEDQIAGLDKEMKAAAEEIKSMSEKYGLSVGELFKEPKKVEPEKIVAAPEAPNVDVDLASIMTGNVDQAEVATKAEEFAKQYEENINQIMENKPAEVVEKPAETKENVNLNETTNIPEDFDNIVKNFSKMWAEKKAAKDKEIEDLKAKITLLEGQNQEKDQKLFEANNTIRDLNSKLAEQDAKIESQAAEIKNVNEARINDNKLNEQRFAQIQEQFDKMNKDNIDFKAKNEDLIKTQLEDKNLIKELASKLKLSLATLEAALKDNDQEQVIKK